MMATPRTGVVLDVPIGRLHPHERNPRKITAGRMEQLKASLEAEAEMMNARPLIALPDGTVIAGNHRLLAARELGWAKIKVVYADLDEERAIEWMLRDNQGYADEVDDQVAALLAELNAAGRDLALTGFDTNDLDQLLRRTAPQVDPDLVPDKPQRPKSNRGTIYELGPHRLMCGDSGDPTAMKTLINGDLAVLVLADPPYNVNYRGGTNHPQPGVVKRERDDAYQDIFSDYKGWLERVLRNAYELSDGRAPLMLWHSTSQLPAVLAAVADAMWTMRSYIIWNKGSIQGGLGQTAKQYRTQFEPLLHAVKKSGRPRWHGPGNESDVWDVPGPRNNPLHPTMKPTALYERTIQNHTQRGQIVLECFGGSGTAIIGAEISGRVCYAMEIDPGYCDVIRQRYADYVDQPDLAP